MLAYIIRRLLLGLLIIWGVYTITFFAVNLAPGDPFTGQENAKISEADLQRLRVKWGYDKSRIARYFHHMRKMFYADAHVVDSEGGGLRFDVSGREDGGNQIAVSVQVPPEEIVIKPERESVLDWGSKEVRLKRLPDGTYETKSIINGKYRFGLEKIVPEAADVSLDSQGVIISYTAKTKKITARDALKDPPAVIQLRPTRKGARPITITRNADGTYPVVAADYGRYEHEGGSADLLVPEETLETGGLTFDLGTSIKHNKSVVDFLKPKLWATIKLGFFALLVNYLLGILLGVISAVRKGTPLDNTIMVGAFFLYSMPGFWLALMLQLLLALKLGWLPLDQMGDGSFLDAVRHYAMPVFVLGVAGAAGTARYQRSAVLEVLGEDYVRTARAKGLDPKTVVRKHVMRNSLLPIITLFGLSMPFLVSGAVITEKIFSWPGIGRAAIEAITGRDVFVVTAITLTATVMVVLGNLIADILYAFADPRVRLK